MITRPLDLASRLRPPPRNFDFWFFINIGLMLLAFFVFGSRFVLALGLGTNFQLPEMIGVREQAIQTTHDIAVKEAGLIVAKEGPVTLKRLGEYLKEEAKKTKQPVLLVRAESGVQISLLFKIGELAQAAGFRVQTAAQEPAKPSGGR